VAPVTNVWIDGARIALAPANLLGQGGEAEVYDLGDGRVVKRWKPPDHPDFAGDLAATTAALARLRDAPARLRALPPKLPAAVIAPAGFALAGKRSSEIVGYVMPKVRGELLCSYGEPRWRRDHPVPGDDIVALLLALHDAIAGLHRAGVVIGDCNDLNVLVDGRRVHLIDVDSYQLPGFPCAMFSERFVDPRLCDPKLLVPVRPHDEASDWYAFAVMAFRTLLGVAPWGGVTPRCPGPLRALRRISALAADVVYPRAARPLATLPDDLLDTFRAIFERDQRGTFPRAALERLHLRKCPGCGDEHARVRCPSCAARAHVPPAVVSGRLRWQRVPIPASALPRIWIESGALWREGQRIGDILPGQTRFWHGERLGVGFYRAGGYTVGFVFDPRRGGLNDQVPLPPIRGQLVAAHAAVGDDRAWLSLVTASAGRLVTTLIAIAADGRVLAAEPFELPGLGGACAVGPHLFVPTDAGIARVDCIQNTIVHTRTFAETAPLVSASDRLVISSGALVAVRRDDAIRMELS
jgi:hypothetical protein